MMNARDISTDQTLCKVFRSVTMAISCANDARKNQSSFMFSLAKISWNKREIYYYKFWFDTLLGIRIDPLHDPVTWYKITHAGEQVAQWDLRNNATRTNPPEFAFVLEVPLRNLLTSICDFVTCDRIVQRAYWADGDTQVHFTWCRYFTKNNTMVSPLCCPGSNSVKWYRHLEMWHTLQCKDWGLCERCRAPSNEKQKYRSEMSKGFLRLGVDSFLHERVKQNGESTF